MQFNVIEPVATTVCHKRLPFYGQWTGLTRQVLLYIDIYSIQVHLLETPFVVEKEKSI